MKNTSRQRMLDAFNFNHPDKIPVVYHPSRGGLHVHGEALLELLRKYPSDNPIDFDGLPVVPPAAFRANGDYHELITDEWGIEWESRIFGIAGHPKTYPFASWKEGVEGYQFPPIPAIGSAEFLAEKAKMAQQKREYLVFNGWISLFEKLHGVRPFDEVLMDLLAHEPDLMRFLDRLEAYWMQVVEYNIALGTDVFVFGDDWGTQTSTLISPDLFGDLFKPRYKRLIDRIKEAGGLPFLHCCGYMGELMGEFMELGIRGLWPQIMLFDQDPLAQSMCVEHKMAIYIHPDRQQLIPLGTPAQIEEYIRTTAQKYKALGGGAIFYVEIENDAPFENVQALIESIHRYR